MTLLEVLASAFGIAMAFANFPQAYKIFKRKSAKDISVITYGLFTSGSFIWFIYGIEIANSPIIISYSVGTFSALLVLIGWFFIVKSCGMPISTITVLSLNFSNPNLRS
tara:strand:- start:37 stop:363 length:327 start_codon:yes stop_codon:yes gene_type:complete